MRTRNVLLLYFALVFGISWSGFVLAAERDNLYLMLVAMVLGPTGTTLALTSIFEGGRGLRELAHRLSRWHIGARWYAMVLVAPALLVVELGALSLISPKFLPAIVSNPERGAIVVDALIIGLGAGICEEVGWTGFVTPRLLRHYSCAHAGVVDRAGRIPHLHDLDLRQQPKPNAGYVAPRGVHRRTAAAMAPRTARSRARLVRILRRRALGRSRDRRIGRPTPALDSSRS
jgi:hypothetical protein